MDPSNERVLKLILRDLRWEFSRDVAIAYARRIALNGSPHADLFRAAADILEREARDLAATGKEQPSS